MKNILFVVIMGILAAPLAHAACSEKAQPSPQKALSFLNQKNVADAAAALMCQPSMSPCTTNTDCCSGFCEEEGAPIPQMSCM